MSAAARLQATLDDFDRENAEDIAADDFNVGQDEFIEVSAADLRSLLKDREEAQPYGWIYEKFAPGPGWCAPNEWWPAEFTKTPPKPETSRNVIALYTTPPAPEAEKMRVAVEALKGAKQIASRLDGHDAEMMADEIEEIDQALAALQQDGR
nr:hypothetical protein [Brevundimonas diminuta]